MNEAAWESLLGSIRENRVVPIIGPRLLVGADGKTSLYRQIAEQLLRSCRKSSTKIALPPYHELQEAVSFLLKGSVAPQELYDAVHKAILDVTNAKSFTLPRPLQQLAEITDFRLFVSLTPDDLLARSLSKRGVSEIVHSPALTESKELSSDWREQSDQANVLYLFGKSCFASQMFAIHDEDILEYAHNIITKGDLTIGMFLNVLKECNLLLIGCNFPEWLSRFFLRATNRQRLSQVHRRSWLIEQLKPKESFTCFLRRYSGNTEVLSDLSPASFVEKLHAKWMKEHRVVKQQPKSVTDKVVPLGAMFFISYSRTTDVRHAKVLYSVLRKLGVPKKKVWFDRKALEPGDDFQLNIQEGIQTCQYFLPLLSHACIQRDEAFVFREWEEATERLKRMNRAFVFPVIVDTKFEPEQYKKYKQKSVRYWLGRDLNFAHAPQGKPGDELMSKLNNLVRQWRRENQPR